MGDAVTALGNALGRGGLPAVTTGHVTALDQDITVSDDATGASQDMKGLIQIDAVLQPGDSGGPLVDDQGAVVGIDAAGSGGVQLRRRGGGTTEGFAIPIATAMEIRKQIEEGKASASVHVGPSARLGVRTTDAGGSIPGVVVVDVASGSPADDAGLQPTDTITAIDGKQVQSPSELSAVIQAHAPGDSVDLVWTDSFGQENHAKVTLEEGPPGSRRDSLLPRGGGAHFGDDRGEGFHGGSKTTE